MTRAKQLIRFAMPLVLVAGLGAAGKDVPLVDAAKRADVTAARALLKKSTDVNQTALDGSTALHWAVQNDAVEIVDDLLKAGANIKAENHYHVTPLSLACTNGSFAIVERLLRAG